jgi:hypothetical protein
MIAATRRNWLVVIAILAAVATLAIIVAGRLLAARAEPYIRDQAIDYLKKRFDSDVELPALRIRLSNTSPLKLVLKRGRGVLARVEGESILLRHKRAQTPLPLFRMKRFSFQVDLGDVFSTRKIVHDVTIDGMEINIPPEDQRPSLDTGGEDQPYTGVVIEDVLITNSILRIVPKDKHKQPLEFDLHRVHLESVAKNASMKYDATIRNAKPPGEIQSKGNFGPWAATEPGDTPLKGEYDFSDADLGVFDGIAGILHSTGQFQGTLNSISVHGEASVPKFRLKSSGNPVSLSTRFDVLVDGTNGNTILKPVIGTLGSTTFTTSGGIIKHEVSDHRGISLNVTMPSGNLRDLLTLAMKGSPFMEGEIYLKTKIDIPPLSGKVKQKLSLDGVFQMSQARFLRSKIQNQIDVFSRRGQGRPTDEQIVDVPSGMAGSFKLLNEIITFRSLSFAVPGAGVDLTGNYNLREDQLDFHGTLKLQAKVSQTMSGWKRWVLKPIDPFFSKQGAGTLIHIQVTGTSEEPKFGRDRGSN